LLSDPLNVEVLTALNEEPRALVDLRRMVGSPPQTTMRAHLRQLTELGVLERRRQDDFPGSVNYELGVPGRELMEVVDALDAWLARCPSGPIVMGTRGATSAVKALVGGWSATIVRALAARPLSLTDLNRLITVVNYPTLERRLSAMRLAGMIESCRGRNRSRPYSVTAWLRRASGPLTVAALWERRNLGGQTQPLTGLDIEAAFLLAVPSLELDSELSGTCRLAASFRREGEEHYSGVKVEVEEGRVVTCVSKLGGTADAWASGSAFSWIRALIDHDTCGLELGGDSDLALALFAGLHESLFRDRERAKAAPDVLIS
jgi:DNA-binding HxlR family transcriptional regulator